MIRRQQIVTDFFADAEEMRRVLDARFNDPYTDSIPWYYFCDPRMYAYLRTTPQHVFSSVLFSGFMQRLRQWCLENLGLVPMEMPNLHLMVNGCRLGLHSDFHNGTWGYVYSLTRWEGRKFTGGETLLLRDGVPSYKKHHVHGEVLYELVPANFNQLLVFDDRIVHATPTVEGSMDPLEGRIAMVGHIRASSPVVTGSILPSEVRRVLLEALPPLRERIRKYREVQGVITFRLAIAETGAVGSVAVLTDNLVTQGVGYEPSETVDAVRSIVKQTVSRLLFPSGAGGSTIVAPILVPLPELRPIEFMVECNSTSSRVKQCLDEFLRGGNGSGLQGTWEDGVFIVREPIAGSIRVESTRVVASFDPPMWVPSQREKFQNDLAKRVGLALAC